MKHLCHILFIAVCLFYSTTNQAEPIAQPIPATELFKAGALSQFQFSPNGEHISAQVNYPDGKGIALYDKQTNEFELIIKLSEQNWVSNYHWLDSSHLFLRFDNDFIELNTIVKLEKENGKIHFKSNALPKKGYLVGQLKGSPTQLLFATDVGKKQHEYQLYQLSIEELISGKFPKTNRIKDLLDTDDNTRLVFDTDTNQLISVRVDKENKKINVHYRSLDGSEWQPLFSFNPVEFNFSPQQFLADGSLAVLTNKKSDKMALYRFNVQTQELGELIYEHPRYDLIDADFVDGQLASVSYLAHGRLEQQFFTVKHQQLQQELNQYFPHEQWLLMANHSDQLILKVFASNNPGQFFFYQKGQVPKLIGSILPELTKYKLAPSNKLQVKSHDGLEIESLLTLPLNNSNPEISLIVMPHGGPIGVLDTDDFDPTVQFLASRGFAVLRTNFRGSAGYGKSFRKMGVAELGEGIEQDIRSSVAEVRKHHKINRACAMGYSYGGYSAMMLAIKEPEFYSCVIAGYGIYDLPLLFNASNVKVQPEHRVRVERVIGPLTPGLKARSPVYMADKVKSPVFLIGGMEDDIAGFEQTHRMYDALKRAGKPVQEMFYQETGHGQSRWDLEHHQIGLIEQFLIKHLIVHDEQTTAQSPK
jgi:dipeptidyl aminopeptidase/acylaminoacyl peptidase